MKATELSDDKKRIAEMITARSTFMPLIDPGNAKQLFRACKAAYRKHHLNDDSIDWDELGHILKNALASTMGDDVFVAWVEKQKGRNAHGAA